MKDLGPDINVDGDRGLRRRQHTTRADLLIEVGGWEGLHAPTCPPSPCPPTLSLEAQPSGGRHSSFLPQSPHTSWSPVFISIPVPTLSPSLPSWAGALVAHGLSPLSWGRGEGPCAEVQCRGQERDADCLCDTTLLSDAHSRAPAPRWVPQVTFWVLHVGQGMGSPASPHGEPCAACSALTPGLLPHPRALPPPSLPQLSLGGWVQGAEGQAAMWWGLGPAQGGREKERERGASAQSLRLLFPLLVLSPPLSPSQACQGRRWGGTGAPVSLELESSPSFINMQISKF